MSADSITREYVVKFNRQPSLLQLQRELETAERIFGRYVTVGFESNGSSDPNLVELYMLMRNETP